MTATNTRFLALLGTRTALICLGVGFGMATSVVAKPSQPGSQPGQPGARTYSTKGKVTSLVGGKLIIKDKFGADWEYNSPSGLTTSVGQDIKVVYVMQAVKIEAP